jgi:hypothetical protein
MALPIGIYNALSFQEVREWARNDLPSILLPSASSKSREKSVSLLQNQLKDYGALGDGSYGRQQKVELAKRVVILSPIRLMPQNCWRKYSKSRLKTRVGTGP